jgi:hypothetical protein
MTWRFRGSTPSPDQWVHSLWQSVVAQHLVVSRLQDKPVGLVLVYRPDFQDGHAHLAALRFDSNDESPLIIFGLALFLRYVFACWNFRKLYMEVSEFNFAQFASGEGTLFQIEGRLRDHLYFNDRYWDQLVLAIHRTAWQAHGTRYVAAEDAALPSGGPPTVSIRIPVPGTRS